MLCNVESQHSLHVVPTVVTIQPTISMEQSPGEADISQVSQYIYLFSCKPTCCYCVLRVTSYFRSYPRPDQSNPHSHITLTEDRYLLSIVLPSTLTSSKWASVTCSHTNVVLDTSGLCVLHAPPILSPVTLSP